MEKEIIITMKIMTGKTFKFRVPEEYPIAELKEMIANYMQDHEGWPIGSYPMRLVYAGKILKETSESIATFKKSFGESKHDITVGEGHKMIRVYVKGSQKMYISVKFTGNEGARQLKQRIFSACLPFLEKPEDRVHSFETKLFIGDEDIDFYLREGRGFPFVSLENLYPLKELWTIEIISIIHGHTLVDFGVGNKSMIYLVYRLGRDDFKGNRFPILSTFFESIRYEPGLSFVGKCMNQKCGMNGVEKTRSYGKNKHWFDSQLHCSILKCPKCPTAISIKEFVFTNCHYKISGIKLSEVGDNRGSERKSTGWRSIGENELARTGLPEHVYRYSISIRFYKESPNLWCSICQRRVSYNKIKSDNCGHEVEEACLQKAGLKCHVCDLDEVLPLNIHNWKDSDKIERSTFVKDEIVSTDEKIFEIKFVSSQSSLKVKKSLLSV